jgi:hypothetical protein
LAKTYFALVVYVSGDWPITQTFWEMLAYGLGNLFGCIQDFLDGLRFLGTDSFQAFE